MRCRGLLISSLSLLSLALMPAMASARDVKLCADLYGRLRNAPAMNPNAAQMRQYSQALADKNIEIRKLRVDMRNAGCGGGSIVVIGATANPACEDMRQQLQSLETARETVAAERNAARQPAAYSNEERTALLASIRANACLPSDYEEQRKADEMERLRIRGIALPKEDQKPAGATGGMPQSASLPSNAAPSDDPQSGITHLRTLPSGPSQASASNPPLDPRERPYDPSQKVRMVGPVFLPDDNIDLAHPKREGAQPQQ